MAVGSQLNRKITAARTAKTVAARNALRVRNSISRSLRAIRHASARKAGGRRAAMPGDDGVVMR
ncbi:MAG: hypothetical protein ACK55I_46870, partial [bacterium]